MVDVAFIGFVDQAAYVHDPLVPSLMGWNILGLKPYLLTPFVPAVLGGVRLAFAARDITNQSILIRIRSITGAELGWIRMGVQTMLVTRDPNGFSYCF